MFQSAQLLLVCATLLVSVSGECTFATPCIMPNIGYIGLGYDLARGNPQCQTGCAATAGIDPGWASTSPVIKFIYDNTTTGDGRFYVPQGFHLLRTPKCSMSSSTTAIHSTTEYQKSLSVDASVSGGGLGWSFSASGDYAKTSQSLNSYSQTSYHTTAICSVYKGNVLPDYPLPLTEEFKTGVANLPASYDEQKYLGFVSNYGTHYVKNVFMGAKFTYQMLLATSDVQSMTSKSVDVAAAVSVSAIIAHASVSANVSWHSSDYNSISQFHKTTTEIIIGQGPKSKFNCTNAPCSPDQMDLSSWQEELLQDSAELAPLTYTLSTLEDFLTAKYFPNDPDIAAKAENFFQFLSKDYCGSVPGCAPPNPLGYWNDQPPLILPRIAAAGVVSGSFFVIGGLDASTGKSTSTVQAFLSEDTGIRWITGATMPTPRHNCTASTDIDGAIYVFGGQQSSGPGSNPSEVLGVLERYDPRTNQWNQQKPMPNPRYSMASTAFIYDKGSAQIWLLGGNLNGHATNAVDVYHSDTDTWLPAHANMTTPREGLCVGVIEGVLYAAGGFNGSSFLSSMEAFINGTWTEQPPMSYARSGSSCAVVDGTFVVAGGLSASGISRLVEAFDPKQQKWIRRSDALSPQWLAASGAVYDYPESTHQLFAAGGTSDLPLSGEGGQASLGIEKWAFPTGDRVVSSPTLSPDGSTVYFGSDDNSLYAVDASTGKEKWAFPTGRGVVSSPTLSPDGSTVYFGSDDNSLYAVDASTGKEKWAFPTGRGVVSSPTLSPDGSTVYFGSDDHSLYAVWLRNAWASLVDVRSFYPEI